MTYRHIRVEDEIYGIVEPSGKLFIPSISTSPAAAWVSYVKHFYSDESSGIAELLELQKRGSTCERLRVEHYDTVHESVQQPVCSAWSSLSTHGNCRNCGHPKSEHITLDDIVVEPPPRDDIEDKEIPF